MRFLPFFILLASVPSLLWAQGPSNEGESIYRQGALLSGEPVRAEREPGVQISGAEVACVNCHRRSGLGSEEGRYIIPPISGKYLFSSASGSGAVLNVAQIYGGRPGHPPYTDITLAKAIREGITPDGRELSYLMPRFKLSDAAVGSLTAYLKALTSSTVPGVTDDTLHFATIVTPDADPVKRQGMLDVLEHFFASKNAFFRESPKMHTARGIMYRVSRKWQLHVWELTGPPETWEQQLHEHLLAEPVFAVISGIGAKTWAPIHQFCEHDAIPCIFPNADLPVVAEKDFYSVYFSKGVLLEAELLSGQISNEMKRSGLRRVVQVFRKEDIGVDAAKAVSDKLTANGIQTLDYVLKDGNPRRELSNLLKGMEPDSAVIFWLRPQDLASLPPEGSKKPKAVFMSGLMGGLENSSLPAAWRGIAHMTYPLDLPERRKIRMNYSSTWLKIQHVPIVDERVQADTYLACSILSESLGEMLDSFVRDYLVERIEDMLSRMIVTGYYPRLGLAPGQRFASKGGYLVHFAGDSSSQLVADGGWVVP